MKRLFAFVALAGAMLLASCSEFDDSKIWDKLDNHESRISQLEELCKQMNTNISSLQTIVNALQENDYITNVSPIRKDGEVIGYTITFAHSDTITIYNGTDGEDGEDGYTPQIGVMKDVDDIYYWTIDGEWLLDGKGNKIQAIGENGEDGENGKDSITPRLKIENDYWHVSYDEGVTWEQLGKATGNNGLNGADGDNIFNSVTQDDEYVYFNLADGTMITLPKHDKENIQFEDLQVKAICCKAWDTNSDGELSYTEAASVRSIDMLFKNNTDILVFTELQYFTGLSEIPTDAFNGCVSLMKIALPKSITTIGDNAFYQCENLSNIPINAGVLSIGNKAFYGCDKFTNIIIPDSVHTIGESAFGHCENLSNISIGKGVVIIGREAFSSCTKLTCVVIPDKISSIEHGMFMYCRSLSSVTISNSVSSIGSYAFMECHSLSNVTIPDSVVSIGDSAFYGCI